VADELLEGIAAGLATFRDPDGSPAVAEAVRPRALYPGRQAGRLPDLVVRWSDRPATTLRAVHSERYGEVQRAGVGSGRSGNHTAGDAWALVVPGASEHAETSRPPRLTDVAATICEVLGADREGLGGETLLRLRR
jgi:predicted AlkP superfamily phosphohydrolase/phosphomutase